MLDHKIKKNQVNHVCIKNTSTWHNNVHRCQCRFYSYSRFVDLYKSVETQGIHKVSSQKHEKQYNIEYLRNQEMNERFMVISSKYLIMQQLVEDMSTENYLWRFKTFR